MATIKSTIPILFSTILSVPALGDDIYCQSDYGEETLDGNLMVAEPCTLNGTKVEGNVTLFAGGSLVAIDATIDGNIKARTADFVELKNSEVDGNVELRDMVGDVSIVLNSAIEGKLVVKDSRSRIDIQDNHVDGKLDVAKNNGEIIIAGNVIDGDLKCKNNAPAPNGGDNQVSGKKTGQCAVLEAVSSLGETENDAATGTTGESDIPPFEIKTGTGGGASIGPLFVALLLMFSFARFHRRRTLRATEIT